MLQHAIVKFSVLRYSDSSYDQALEDISEEKGHDYHEEDIRIEGRGLILVDPNPEPFGDVEIEKSGEQSDYC